MAIANFQTLSLVGLLHSHTCSEWWAVWILCLWLPSHLLPSAGCFCNCSTLNQWVICGQWVKQLRIQLRCCNRMKPLQQVLFDVPRSAGCGVTAKVKHSSSVFKCQTTKRHRSTALQTFYRCLEVSLPPNLTFKLFLTTTPQLLIYCVLHYNYILKDFQSCWIILTYFLLFFGYKITIIYLNVSLDEMSPSMNKRLQHLFVTSERNFLTFLFQVIFL